MYNLIIAGGDDAWETDLGQMDTGRVFEFTDRRIAEQFDAITEAGRTSSPKYSDLARFPSVLAYEKGIDKPAIVVEILSIRHFDRQLKFRFRANPSFPPVADIYSDPLAFDLGIDKDSWEPTRTHWAVKDIDLEAVWPTPQLTPPAVVDRNSQVGRQKIFVVHGRDDGPKESVARFLEKAGLSPIILAEMPDGGRTVIEKFVAASQDIAFAVVLLTPDDVGALTGESLSPRARQNVILELGYFVALLGRDRVCALRKGSVEVPSDFVGVVYKDLDSGEGWKLQLWRELMAAGFSLDPRALA